MKTNALSFRLILITALTIGIIGCGGGGGGGGDTPTVNEGTFVDAAVSGLNYQTATQSGITDSNGTFKYLDGETVTFSIGNVVLGQGMAKTKMTPIDLVQGATDSTNPIVTNICRFLISLDVDANPDNGITISAPIRNEVSGRNIDLTQTATPLEDNPDIQSLLVTLNALGVFTGGNNRTLCDAQTAQQHLENTITGTNPANISDFVGTWAGIVIAGVGNQVESSNVTITLVANGDTLLGTSTGVGISAHNNGYVTHASFSGTVTNGVFSFILPIAVEDAGSPDCVGWDVNGAAALNANRTTLNVSFSGMFCGQGGATQGTASGALTKQSSATLASITVTPANPSIALGSEASTEQFTATGAYSDGTNHDITTQVAWTSSNTAVATINPGSGLATAMAAGTTTINATLGGVSGHTDLTVTTGPPPVTLTSITVTPVNPGIALGGMGTSTEQFAATGAYSDGTNHNITTQVTWSSSNTAAATINPGSGLATAMAAGTTTITATLGGISGDTILTVTGTNSPALSDFVGTWAGIVTAGVGNQAESSNVTITLVANGNTLFGTLIGVGISEHNLGHVNHNNFSGTVTNGVFSFILPIAEEDAGSPDCVGWDVNGAATLNANRTTLNVSFSGMFCGQGGVTQGTAFGTLTKQ